MSVVSLTAQPVGGWACPSAWLNFFVVFSLVLLGYSCFPCGNALVRLRVTDRWFGCVDSVCFILLPSFGSLGFAAFIVVSLSFDVGE